VLVADGRNGSTAAEVELHLDRVLIAVAAVIGLPLLPDTWKEESLDDDGWQRLKAVNNSVLEGALDRLL
jgi:hypothetical protein